MLLRLLPVPPEDPNHLTLAWAPDNPCPLRGPYRGLHRDNLRTWA